MPPGGVETEAFGSPGWALPRSPAGRPRLGTIPVRARIPGIGYAGKWPMSDTGTILPFAGAYTTSCCRWTARFLAGSRAPVCPNCSKSTTWRAEPRDLHAPEHLQPSEVVPSPGEYGWLW